jgi:hypothetical protein
MGGTAISTLLADERRTNENVRFLESEEDAWRGGIPDRAGGKRGEDREMLPRSSQPCATNDQPNKQPTPPSCHIFNAADCSDQRVTTHEEQSHAAQPLVPESTSARASTRPSLTAQSGRRRRGAAHRGVGGISVRADEFPDPDEATRLLGAASEHIDG